MTILFFLFLLATIFLSIVIKKSSKITDSKKENDKKRGCIIVCIIIAVEGLADLTGIIKGRFDGAFTLLGITAVIEMITWHFGHKKNMDILRFLGKAFIIVSVLELTVFQAPSYKLMFESQYEKTLPLSQASIENGNFIYNQESDNLIITGKDEVLIEYNDLKYPVNTIFADVEFQGKTKNTHVVVDITDETHSDYRYDIAKWDILNNNDKSSYVPCEFSGELGKLRVKFTNYKDYDSIVVKSITINKAIPFDISYIRVFLVVMLSVLVYSVVSYRLFRVPFYKSSKLCAVIFGVLTIGCCILTVLIINAKLGDDNTMKDHMKLTQGNQITEELVEAFEHKQISLLKHPPAGLTEIENPYDWGQRGEAGFEYEWDHVYYNGKYYSYYGIAPVILLYLPYHIITGYYCSTNLSIMLFSIIGMVFLSMTYYVFLKKWYKKIPVGIAIAGHVILLSACGIWFCIGRNIFYEISISSGFMFVAIGSFLLFSSNVLCKGKISLIKVILSSVFMGLAVLCRPTLAVYCICTCIYYAYGLFKKEELISIPVNESADTEKKFGPEKNKHMNKWAYLACALVPLILLGSVQMWYNAARFGSPFDFGIKYSLTINDFIHSQYHTIFVMIGLFNYFFAVPSFSLKYPFITTPFSSFDANGYYFSDVGNTSGILFLALPVFAYFLSRKVLKSLPDKRAKIKALFTIGVPCIVMPFIIIFSTWESGYAVRYTADFSWQMILGAYAIIFYLYTKSQDKTKKRFINKFMAFSAVSAVIINSIQIFNFTFSVEDYPDICYTMEHLFAFWK